MAISRSLISRLNSLEEKIARRPDRELDFSNLTPLEFDYFMKWLDVYGEGLPVDDHVSAKISAILSKCPQLPRGVQFEFPIFLALDLKNYWQRKCATVDHLGYGNFKLEKLTLPQHQRFMELNIKYGFDTDTGSTRNIAEMRQWEKQDYKEFYHILKATLA